MATLLIAEDDEDIAVVLARVCKRAGLDVLRAPDGQAALEMIVEKHPDALLTDLGMPRMDGWELIRKVREHPEVGDIPVAILTGQLAPGDPRAAEAEACAVLLKPCPNDQLLATIQELLQHGPHDARSALRSLQSGREGRAMVAGSVVTPDTTRSSAPCWTASPSGWSPATPTGRVVLVNRAMREVRGLPPDGPLPADYAEASRAASCAGPDLRPLPWEQTPLMRALRGEHVVAEDVCIRGARAAGRGSSPAPPSRSSTPASRLLGAVAVAHEVTALRRAERFRACHLAVEHVLKRAGTAAEAAPGRAAGGRRPRWAGRAPSCS